MLYSIHVRVLFRACVRARVCHKLMFLFVRFAWRSCAEPTHSIWCVVPCVLLYDYAHRTHMHAHAFDEDGAGLGRTWFLLQHPTKTKRVCVYDDAGHDMLVYAYVYNMRFQHLSDCLRNWPKIYNFHCDDYIVLKRRKTHVHCFWSVVVLMHSSAGLHAVETRKPITQIICY